MTRRDWAAYRYAEFNGRRYAHILDPATGYPVDEILQATVIDPDPVRADAAATALVVAGASRWREVAEAMGLIEAIVVDDQGRLQRLVRGAAE